MAEITKTKAELDLEKKQADESYYGGTRAVASGDFAKDNLWMTKE